MEIAPFHSTDPRDVYYHNNNECSAANMIPLHDLAPGPGDKLSLCPACAQLNRAQDSHG